MVSCINDLIRINHTHMKTSVFPKISNTPLQLSSNQPTERLISSVRIVFAIGGIMLLSACAPGLKSMAQSVSH